MNGPYDQHAQDLFTFFARDPDPQSRRLHAPLLQVWDVLRGKGSAVSSLTYAAAASGSGGDGAVFEAVCDALRDVRERTSIPTFWAGGDEATRGSKDCFWWSAAHDALVLGLVVIVVVVAVVVVVVVAAVVIFDR